MTISSDRQYHLLFDQMFDAGLLLEVIRGNSGDPAGFRIIEVNHKAEEVLGCRRDDIIGRDFVTTLPSIAPAVFDLFVGVVQTGMPVHREISIPDLDLCYELKAYQPEKDQIVAIINDTTYRQQAEKRLRIKQRDLDNRVRELTILYVMTDIVERYGVSVVPLVP